MGALAWDPAATEPVVALLGGTACFLAYYYGVPRERLLQRWLAAGGDREALQIKSVLAQRVGGFVLLGLAPLALALLAVPSALEPLGPGDVAQAAGWVGFGAIAVLPFLANASRAPNIQATYPEIRAREWTPGLWAASAGSWGLFLLGYEYLFRGFLLFSLAHAFGTWPAIAAVTALYALAHLHKPAQETVGSLLMGVLFGAMAIATKTWLAPFALHWFIAMTSETLALRANPGMRFGSAGAR